MPEQTFKPGDTVKNRNVSIHLIRRGPNPGEWVVKQFIETPGVWRKKFRVDETIVTEKCLIEMAADAAVRNMTRVSDATSVSTKKPTRRPLDPIRLAQFRLADRRALLMKATN